MLEVEDAEPARVKFSLPWAPIPAGSSVIGFDIDSATRSRVIDALANQLKEYYVLVDAADQMEDVLTEHLRTGHYDDITNGWIFANELTKDLRAVSRDKHLVVGFSPIANGPPLPSADASRPVQMNPASCGFERSEMLADDIGYIKINQFVDPTRCGSSARDVLASMTPARAIFFDLRDATGGHAGMVAFIVAQLFEETVQLSAVHWRQPPGVQELRAPERIPALSLHAKPVYVLTSTRTFSGAEAFAYDLQALKRVTIVGETTAGGAHVVRPERIDERFSVNLPYGRAVNPITGTNWEGVGVVPDKSVPAASALEAALRLVRAL
jgi:hypothetical protein